MTPGKAFGQVLAKIRKEKGVSQEKLADICGMDRTFISLMERGLRQPSLGSILTLAEALGIAPSRMVHLVEKKLKA